MSLSTEDMLVGASLLSLIDSLDELNEKLGGVHLFWVKGHSGHPQNELCDQLANQALDEAGL